MLPAAVTVVPVWVKISDPSREKPIPGVTGEMVVEAALRSGHRNVHYCLSWKDAPELLRGEVGPKDVVITLGAGDVNRLAQGLAREEDGA